jgi:hypothetical protein
MDVHIAAGPLQNAAPICPVERCAKGLFMSVIYRVTRGGLAAIATVYLCEIHGDTTYRVDPTTGVAHALPIIQPYEGEAIDRGSPQ